MVSLAMNFFEYGTPTVKEGSSDDCLLHLRDGLVKDFRFRNGIMLDVHNECERIGVCSGKWLKVYVR